MKKVYVDGSYGTVGLILSDLIKEHPLLKQLEVTYSLRKDIPSRMGLMEQADIVVTCLPNNAVNEIVSLVPDSIKLLDCSTQYRCNDNWIYGLPELNQEQRNKIKDSNRIANSGCFASAFILAIKPLVDSDALSKRTVVSSYALTGYSAGGSRMLKQHDDGESIEMFHSLNMNHKHLPEMKKYTELSNAPLFIPAIGSHKEGLILTVPLSIDLERSEILDVLRNRYCLEKNIIVHDNCPDCLLPTYSSNNNVDIYVGGVLGSISITVKLNNLYKGAAGNALQCINLMLEFDECMGLN